MKNSRHILFVIILSAFLPGANWEDHDVRIIKSEPDAVSGKMKYHLRDSSGKNFEAHYVNLPDDKSLKRSLELKDLFFGWEKITPDRMEFHFSEKVIFTNVRARDIAYRGRDLREYLPAGLSFFDTDNDLTYRFRIVIKNTSYMIEGDYLDEENLLRNIYDFISDGESGKKLKTSGGWSLEEKEESPPEARSASISPRISAYCQGNYIKPLGTLSQIFSDGYGGTVGLTLHNTGISLREKTLFQVDFTLMAGYWRLGIKDDPGANVSCEVTNSYVIPVMLKVRYPIPLVYGFFAAPSLGVGYNYNSLDYCKTTASGPQTVEVREWAASLSAGMIIGYDLVRNRATIIAGFDYQAIYERNMTASSFSFFAGAEYSLVSF